MKIARSGSETGSVSQRYGSPDPDPYQNATDPQHWLEEICTLSKILAFPNGTDPKLNGADPGKLPLIWCRQVQLLMRN
jgi:hypothetical protein